MCKLGKLIQKLLRDPPELSYDDVMQDLSGCISTSESLQEAMDNILDAKKQWLEAAIQYQDPIPLPSNMI